MIHEWPIWDLINDSYFWVLLGFFCIFGYNFRVGWSAFVGAYYSPHAASDPYHILQFIYILYTDFFGFMCFFCEILRVLFLLLVCRNVVRWPLTGYHATAIYTVLYTWVMMMIIMDDGWLIALFWKTISSIIRQVCWKIKSWNLISLISGTFFP